MNEAAVTKRAAPIAKPLGADGYEKCLAVAAAILLAFVIVAVARGRSEWTLIPAIVWAHLATIIIALALTPVMLLRRRGDQSHRELGRLWAASMVLTAFLSLFIRLSNHGGFSVIHILSAYTLVQVPALIWFARQHNIRRHRRAVRAMVTGALLIAGFFTFPFGRLLGHWLFG